MALFKKTTKEKSAPRAKKTVSKTVNVPASYRADVLVRPHVTEKSAILAEKGVYVFEISPRTNKKEVARAIQEIYNVTPVRVNTVNLPKTNVLVRGKRGTKSGVRKALVKLAEGDKIEFI